MGSHERHPTASTDGRALGARRGPTTSQPLTVMPTAGASLAAPFRKNVSLWRAHNHRRWLFEKDAVSSDERVPFVCECTGGDCLEPVDVTTAEFESAHMRPNWFIVLPEHVLPDDSTAVVVRHPDHWVVALTTL
jgi:hypothetical protein